MMTKERLQEMKKDIEERFRKLQDDRKELERKVVAVAQDMHRVQGEYKMVEDMLKEFNSKK
jgi:predicted  nucleic acid-binding Zn-ribbon protein